MEKLQSPNPIFSVSDFIAAVNQTLDFAYPSVEVEGEVSSFKVNQGKFVFFDLKDADGSVGCFMMLFHLRVPIEDGMKVVVSAVPKLTKWGKFSLTVKSIRPSGEGALKKSFELLRAKLDKEGLFAVERKRSLPRIPGHIAVISSTQAAGYADFIKILNDRWGGVRVDVAHVQVQGESAPDQIIRAIDYFNTRQKLPEVLVIVRGGGSVDDLAAFNDEPLVRAIATSRVPTIVGVGHETDESLVDLVADVRAATPSNAAQILVPDKQEIIRSVNVQLQSLIPKMIRAIELYETEVEVKLVSALNAIDRAVDGRIAQLDSLKSVLAQLDPRTVLARGYAILHGKPSVGEKVEIETNKAILKAEVLDVQDK